MTNKNGAASILLPFLPLSRAKPRIKWTNWTKAANFVKSFVIGPVIIFCYRFD